MIFKIGANLIVLHVHWADCDVIDLRSIIYDGIQFKTSSQNRRTDLLFPSKNNHDIHYQFHKAMSSGAQAGNKLTKISKDKTHETRK